jgi:hypothetical protein
MKIQLAHFLTTLLALSLLVIGCSPKDEHTSHDGTVYTCSMHPQIKQDKPGNCPICGMTLTPFTPAAKPVPAAKTKEKAIPKSGRISPGIAPFAG